MKFFKWNFLNERSHIKISQCFPKPFRSFGGNINVKVDLSNYATKADIKNIVHVDTSRFAPVSVDLSKLSDVVKNNVVKTTVYDKLVGKVKNIDTSDFELKNYNADKTELEKIFLMWVILLRKQNSLNYETKFLILVS